MLTVLLVIQIIIAVSMVILILIQRSSSDGLGGLGGGGGNSLMSGRAQANFLTKTTAILATIFMVNSLAMATITARQSGIADRVIENIEKNGATDSPAENGDPAAPSAPVVPLGN